MLTLLLMFRTVLYVFVLLLCGKAVSGLLRLSSNTCSVGYRSRWLLSHPVAPATTSTVAASELAAVKSNMRSARLYMSTRGSGSGGSTKLDRKTVQKTVTKPTYKEEIEKDWRLVLHDDTVHTIQQVCDIVSASCPLCTGPRAYEVTLEVHMTGAGTVAVANKKIITEYTKTLQAAGLTVSMAPDDEFDSSGDGDGDGDGGED